MKNITVTVDDGLYRASRIAAAENQTSVSALVRGYLAALAQGKAPVLPDQGDAGQRKDREEIARLFREARLVLGYKPSRKKSHER